MRKDVKRSLLLWPAAASAAIGALTWVNEAKQRHPVDVAAVVSHSHPWAASQPQNYDWKFVKDLPEGDWSRDLTSNVWPDSGTDDNAIEAILSLGDELPKSQRVVDFPVVAIGEIGSVVERRESGTQAMSIPGRLDDTLASDAILSDTAMLIKPPKQESFIPASAIAQASSGTFTALTQPRIALVLQAPERCERAELAGIPFAPELKSAWDSQTLLEQSVSSIDIRSLDPLPDDESVFLLTPVETGTNQVAEIPQSVVALAKPEPTTALPKSIERDGPQVAESPRIASVANTTKEQVTRRRTEARVGAWPLTKQLNEQLDVLAEYTPIINTSKLASTNPLDISTTAENEQADAALWADEVGEDLAALRSLQRLGDEHAGRLIAQLEEHIAAGYEAAEACEDRDQQREWLRATHALARRVSVWRPVWEVVGEDSQIAIHRDGASAHVSDINALVVDVRADALETGDIVGWSDFLLLDQISEAASSNSVEKRAFVARRLLSRLQWHELTAEHAQWLTTDSVVRLVDAVKPWATTAIDYASLLEYMEDQEADSIDLASRRIAGTAQALRFARNASAIEVSDALNAYYRNANVRLAISKQMLNRVLPQVQPKTIPVRASVLGSRVTGTSHVNSSLSVDLRPSTNEWSIDLLTRGDVHTNSTGLSGPVAVRTNSQSLFNSVTPINIARDGVTVNPSEVNVSGQNRLRGIRTDYDGWPLIGTLVRSIAESRFEEMRPKATRIANRRVRVSVSQEITGEVDAKVNAASEKFAKVVLGPLGDMDLNPSVVDLETTENRLLARYRVAGDWQLGSFTPRPRAPGDSLMSLQIHQTALNNTIEQLVPQGESVSIERMLRDGMISFGKEPDQITLPSELPSDVSIQFAGTRPVTIEIEDGKMYLTLRIVRLSQQNGVDLRRFIVKAEYVPQVNGLNAQLVRSGHLRISGPGMSMRERLPLRAIFNKVLAESRTFPLTMPQLLDHPAAEGLVVSQLELRDGWIGLAISERNEIDKVAVMGLSRR